MSNSLLPPCVFIDRREIDATLAAPAASGKPGTANGVGVPGKRLLEPLKTIAAANGLPLNILEDREVANEAEVHRHEGDLWGCLEGEVTFSYGGVLVGAQMRTRSDGAVNELEIKARDISGGTEAVLKPGDWLWIPAGQPHAHRAAKTARLFIIKIPARAEVPLEAVPGWTKRLHRAQATD